RHGHDRWLVSPDLEPFARPGLDGHQCRVHAPERRRLQRVEKCDALDAVVWRPGDGKARLDGRVLWIPGHERTCRAVATRRGAGWTNLSASQMAGARHRLDRAPYRAPTARALRGCRLQRWPNVVLAACSPDGGSRRMFPARKTPLGGTVMRARYSCI